MATLENRSRYTITVKNRPDLTAYFPFNKFPSLEARMAELRALGFKPRADQLDESWLMRIRQAGYKPLQITLPSRQEAEAFINKTLEERSRKLFHDYAKAHKTTFAELLIRYLENELDHLKSRDVIAYKIEGWLADSGAKGERLLAAYRLRMVNAGGKVRSAKFIMRKASSELEWIHKRLTHIIPTNIEDFIKERLEVVAPSTVDREIDIFKAVFKVATTTWEFDLVRNPMDVVRRPRYFNERDRILTSDEEQRMVAALVQIDFERAVEQRLTVLADAALADQSFSSNSARKKELARVRAELRPEAEQTALVTPYLEAFYHFQVMTAARRGETLGLTWDRIDFEAGTAYLPETKNGRPRKLSVRRTLLNLLATLPTTSTKVFDVTCDYIVKAWRRACEIAGIEDFHIHDLRHIAITKVAATGKFTVPELQQFSGHRDIRMLMRYAHLCAAELAKKLDASFADETLVRGHRGRSFLNKDAGVSVKDLLVSSDAPDGNRLVFDDANHSVDTEIHSTQSNIISFPTLKRA